MTTALHSTKRPVGVTSSAVTIIASAPLHPREWAPAQTGLTLAMRDTLVVLVAAYAGFQLKNDQFYILESRVSPYLRKSFSTFKNYVTALHKLGLLDLVSRCPNQWGERSIWRMNLDVVISNGQYAFAFGDELSADELDEELDAEVAVDEVQEATITEPIKTVTRAETRRNTRNTRSSRPVKSLEQIEAQLAELKVKLLSAEGEIAFLRCGNAANLTPGAASRGVSEVKVRISSRLADEMDMYLKAWGQGELKASEREQAIVIEADYQRIGGGDVPQDYVKYAADETLIHAKSSRSGYMLGVLRRKVQSSHTREGRRGDDGSGKRQTKKSRY